MHFRDVMFSLDFLRLAVDWRVDLDEASRRFDEAVLARCCDSFLGAGWTRVSIPAGFWAPLSTIGEQRLSVVVLPHDPSHRSFAQPVLSVCQAVAVFSAACPPGRQPEPRGQRHEAP